MYRSMMQVYVFGSDKAVEMYQKAFDAQIVDAYPNDDGTYGHIELDVYGQILAIAESKTCGCDVPQDMEECGVSFLPGAKRDPGNTMQFCLHFGEGNADKVHKAYEALQEGALILYPLGSVMYSPCMVDLVDKYGVRWCLFE